MFATVVILFQYRSYDLIERVKDFFFLSDEIPSQLHDFLTNKLQNEVKMVFVAATPVPHEEPQSASGLMHSF